MKKPKKPETIADLKIEWTFETIANDVDTNIELFNKLNPHLKNLKLKGSEVTFIFNDTKMLGSPWKKESLAHYIDFVSYQFSNSVGKKVKLSHFEKLSETEYRIHGKEL